jgi:HK97 family phage major capsid protein
MTTTEAPDRIVEFPALKDAKGKLDAKRDNLASILREAGPNYDMSQVKSLAGDTQAKVEAIRALNTEIDDCKSKVDELLVVARAAAVAAEGEVEGVTEKGVEPGDEPPTKQQARKNWVKSLMESNAIKGYTPGAGSGPMAHLDIDLKTVMSTGAGWDPEDLRTGRLVEFATRPAPHVVNYIPQTTTSMSTVLYMEETTFTNNAAETAESVEGTPGSYPEAALVYTEKNSEVRKIAVFLPVTDEQFEDEPRARTTVENRLPFMLQQRLDSQALVGNGTAPNLRGTENVVGVNTQALGVDPIPDAIYKGMRMIRDTGFAEPSVVFIRPAKWEGVRLLKTADGMYIWGHPSMPGPETIWGVPVVQTTAVTATKAVIGDYSNFAELAVRRGIDVQISNSHGTYFKEGVLALRADMRAALIHYRPSAFSVVTGL